MSIFHLENSSTYRDEYNKIMKVLESKCVIFDKDEYTYFDYINKHLFLNWKFRGTFLDCYDYLEHIGINHKSRKVSKEVFFNLLEFLLNMQLLLNRLKYYSDHTKFSVKCKSILIHNIPLLLESYGLEAYSFDDRIIISSKDLDYDQILEYLPEDINELLISYKSINNNGIKMKRSILYKLFQFLENNRDKYKGYNTSIYNSIKTVIVKMGVSGSIDKKYLGLSNYMLRKYYDYCYSMIIYLIHTENILKYKEEIKNII